MSKAKTDKLGLRLPKELIWGCVCCSLRTNPGKESRAETGASEAAREISSLKVGKMLLQRKLIRGFFYQQKKKKAGLAEKVYSSTFYFFYLPAIQKHWIKMSFSITYYYKRTKSLNTYYNFLLISQNLFAENEKTKSLSLSHIHFTLTL